MRKLVNKPSPITGGPLELCIETAEVTFRGEIIPYEKTFFHCVDSGLEFVDEEQEAANLKLIYDTYRALHSIPMPEELKVMRERYGIPSFAMSLILGLGENQYGLYEEGVVPTPSVGRLLALAKDPVIMRGMLESARSLFSEKQYGKYYSSIVLSMQPAKYETEKKGLLDYCFLTSNAPARLIVCKPKVSSNRKNHYDEYAYATAY